MTAGIRSIVLLGTLLGLVCPYAGAADFPPTGAVDLYLPYTDLVAQISNIGVTDYYKFSVTAGTEITILVRSQSIESPLVPVVALYDSVGTLLAYNKGEVNTYTGYIGDPILYLKIPESGDYYISVGAASSFRTVMPPGSGLIGDYTLTLMTRFDTTIVNDANEPNDSMAAATPISVPYASRAANLLFFGDIDWFRFTAQKGQRFSIDIDSEPLLDQPRLKTRAGVFDRSGALLAQSEAGPDPDDGSASDPSINFTAPRDGTYFVAVTPSVDRQFRTAFTDADFLANPYVASSAGRIGCYRIEIRELYELAFPQVANGSFGEFHFTTSFILLNNTSNAAVGSVCFYQSDGSPLPAWIESGEPTNAYRFSIPPKGNVVVKTDGFGLGQSGYALVTATAPIGGSAVFSQYAADGQLVTEAGVTTSTPMAFFALPVDTTGLFNTGMAVLNRGNGRAVTINCRLLDSAGKLVDSRKLSLGADQQSAMFVGGAGQLFPNAAAMRGSLQVFADAPVTTVALRSSPGTITTLSPAPLNQSYAPASLLFPQFLAGSAGDVDYGSSVILMNTGYVSVSGTVAFTTSDGLPMAVRIGSVSSSVHSFAVPPLSTRVLETSGGGRLQTGYARVSSDHGMAGMIVISQFEHASGNLLSEVGVTPAQNYSHFFVFAECENGYSTGLAIANPDSTAATLSYDLRPADDSAVLHKGPLSLGSGAHVAELVSGTDQLFPGFSGLGTLEVTSEIPLPAVTLRLTPTTMTALPVIPAP
jgi:hypothetical protein